MDNIVKIGYIRKISEKGTSYLSMKDFYAFSDAAKESLKHCLDAGSIKLYCACSEDNNLALTITKDLVLRVAHNGQQENHKPSCPKSVEYTSYTSQNTETGVYLLEDGQMVFNIALPSAIPSYSSSSSSGSTSESPSMHRTNPLNIVIALNKSAWLKQTYSIKKQIGLAHRAGQKPMWYYKDASSFFRLIWGISNDIFARTSKGTLPFRSLYYSVSGFYDNNQSGRPWFICSPVMKISEYKADRKYQYVTLDMPGKTGKACVRIETPVFDKLYKDFDLYPDALHLALCGWVVRKFFPAKEGRMESDWMQLLKGSFFFTNGSGLYVENEDIAIAADLLSKRKVVFFRPDSPYENYGNLIPSFCIPRQGKDILIDIVSGAQLKKRIALAENATDYEIFVISRKDDVTREVSSIIDSYYAKP